jgi:uncharacterized membrane protein YqiK
LIEGGAEMLHSHHPINVLIGEGTTMSKIILAVFITILGIVVWFALKAKYTVRGAGHRCLITWRTDPNIREATLFSATLMAGVTIFTLVQGWLF